MLSQLYRAMAAKQPGVLTHVGLDTYMDPRNTGAKMNAVARDELIEVVQAAGREWLLYKSLPADVAILRGTTADEEGNVSLEEEAVTLETLSIAQAVHNNGGIVICQVKRLAPKGTCCRNRCGCPASWWMPLSWTPTPGRPGAASTIPASAARCRGRSRRWHRTR